MEICVLRDGLIGTNTYVLINKGKAVIIDSEASVNKIDELLTFKNTNAVAVLLTHCHFDHIGSAKAVKEKYNIPVFCSEKEQVILKSPLSRGLFDGDMYLKDSDVLNLADLNIKVLSTPGHSAGSVCYIVENNIFSGDTLFFQSYGRTDLLSGNDHKMSDSLKKLFNLDGDYNVYPGHGSSTTLSSERNFFKGWGY